MIKDFKKFLNNFAPETTEALPAEPETPTPEHFNDDEAMQVFAEFMIEHKEALRELAK